MLKSHADQIISAALAAAMPDAAVARALEQAQNLGRWLNSDEYPPPMTYCGFQQ